MEKDEARKIMGIIRAVYPNFYKDAGKTDREVAVDIWHDMFKGDTFREVEAAVKSFIAYDTKGFPPNIGNIKELLMRLREGADGELSETEAWALVSKALRNGIYGYQQEYAKLPEVVQRCVGSPLVLHDWAQMDIETTNSVVASNFMRSYRARASHVREMQKLPEDVKMLYASVGEAFRLPEPERQTEPVLRIEPGEPMAAPAWFTEQRKKALGDAQAQQAQEAKTRIMAVFGQLMGTEQL